jgi:hypothetical protein
MERDRLATAPRHVRPRSMCSTRHSPGAGEAERSAPGDAARWWRCVADPSRVHRADAAKHGGSPEVTQRCDQGV